MLTERFVTLADYFSGLWIHDHLAIAVIFAIDLLSELIPLSGLTIKIVTGNRLVERLLIAGTLVLHPNFFAERCGLAHMLAKVAS